MRRTCRVKEGHGPHDAIRGKLPVPFSLPCSGFCLPYRRVKWRAGTPALLMYQWRAGTPALLPRGRGLAQRRGVALDQFVAARQQRLILAVALDHVAQVAEVVDQQPLIALVLAFLLDRL